MRRKRRPLPALPHSRPRPGGKPTLRQRPQEMSDASRSSSKRAAARKCARCATHNAPMAAVHSGCRRLLIAVLCLHNEPALLPLAGVPFTRLSSLERCLIWHVSVAHCPTLLIATAAPCAPARESQVCGKSGHAAGFVGSTYIDCPNKPCYLCKTPGHTTATCPHRLAPGAL